MKTRSMGLLGGFAIAMALAFTAGTAIGEKEEGEPLLYELRTYTTAPGRLSALHDRFSNHTMELFEKHGMKNVAYWTPVDKDDTLIYVIAHKDKGAADKSWQAFVQDPDWQKAFKESRKDGPIVEKVERQYLAPTEYSPAK